MATAMNPMMALLGMGVEPEQEQQTQNPLAPLLAPAPQSPELEGVLGSSAQLKAIQKAQKELAGTGFKDKLDEAEWSSQLKEYQKYTKPDPIVLADDEYKARRADLLGKSNQIWSQLQQVDQALPNLANTYQQKLKDMTREYMQAKYPGKVGVANFAVQQLLSSLKGGGAIQDAVKETARHDLDSSMKQAMEQTQMQKASLAQQLQSLKQDEMGLQQDWKTKRDQADLTLKAQKQATDVMLGSLKVVLDATKAGTLQENEEAQRGLAAYNAMLKVNGPQGVWYSLKETYLSRGLSDAEAGAKALMATKALENAYKQVSVGRSGTSRVDDNGNTITSSQTQFAQPNRAAADAVLQGLSKGQGGFGPQVPQTPQVGGQPGAVRPPAGPVGALLTSPETQVSLAVKGMYDNPDSFHEVKPNIKQKVAAEWQRQTGLPAPNKLGAPALESQRMANLAQTHIKSILEILKDPMIAKNIGPIAGRLGNLEQNVGDTFFKSGPQAEKEQELRTRLQYLLFQEGKALLGGRPPERLIRELKDSSASVQKTMDLMKGALGGAYKASKQLVENNDRERFGGKGRNEVKIKIEAPSGKVVEVPITDVNEALKLGGKRVK